MSASLEIMSASLKEAELTRRRLELEGKEFVERAAWAEAERDTACHEAAMARLEAEAAVNARAQVESDLARTQSALAVADSARLKAESELARVQNALGVVNSARLKAESELRVAQEALAAAGEACTKAEEENSRLTDERLSLVLELGTIKDEFATFREKVVTDREAMEAEFDASGDELFNYGYGCCVFTHNICRGKP